MQKRAPFSTTMLFSLSPVHSLSDPKTGPGILVINRNREKSPFILTWRRALSGTMQ